MDSRDSRTILVNKRLGWRTRCNPRESHNTTLETPQKNYVVETLRRGTNPWRKIMRLSGLGMLSALGRGRLKHWRNGSLKTSHMMSVLPARSEMTFCLLPILNGGNEHFLALHEKVMGMKGGVPPKRSEVEEIARTQMFHVVHYGTLRQTCLTSLPTDFWDHVGTF